MTDESERNAALRRRLKLLEAGLTELTEEVSAHHAELEKQVIQLSATVARNQEIVGGKVMACQEAVKELQLMVLGEPRYMLPGLAERIRKMDESIEDIQNERDALKNQLKGLKVGLGLAGGGSLVGLIGFITEFFNK
jgi:hypothetical protein